MIRKLGLVAVTLVLLLLVYAFLAGPLFPYAPFTLGYERVQYERTEVLAYDVNQLPAHFAHGDAIQAEAEAHFGLRFRKPIYVLALGSKREFRRSLPWMNPDVVGAAALETGDIVLVNREKISETAYNEAEFLRHEIVHALQFQNSPLRHRLTMHRHIWMREGVAVHFGGPTYYATPADYRIAFKEYQPGVNPDETSPDIWLRVPATDARFSYTFYGRFITYLVDTYGLAAFQDFYARYLKAPQQFRQHAATVFADDFSVIQHAFLAELP